MSVGTPPRCMIVRNTPSPWSCHRSCAPPCAKTPKSPRSSQSLRVGKPHQEGQPLVDLDLAVEEVDRLRGGHPETLEDALDLFLEFLIRPGPDHRRLRHSAPPCLLTSVIVAHMGYVVNRSGAFPDGLRAKAGRPGKTGPKNGCSSCDFSAPLRSREDAAPPASRQEHRKTSGRP